MSRVGLCYCVSYTECQGLVCVIVCLTLSGKGWSMSLRDVHYAVRVGLCSYLSYTECQGLVCEH